MESEDNRYVKAFSETLDNHNKEKEAFYENILELRNQLEILWHDYQKDFNIYCDIKEKTDFKEVENIITLSCEAEIQYFNNLLIEYFKNPGWVSSDKIGGRTSQKYLSKTYLARGNHSIVELCDRKKIVVKNRKRICYRPKENSFIHVLYKLQFSITNLYNKIYEIQTIFSKYEELDIELQKKEYEFAKNRLSVFKKALDNYDNLKEYAPKERITDKFNALKSQELTDIEKEELDKFSGDVEKLQKLEDQYNEFLPFLNNAQEIFLNSKIVLEERLKVYPYTIKTLEDFLKGDTELLALLNERTQNFVNFAPYLFGGFAEVVRSRESSKIKIYYEIFETLKLEKGIPHINYNSTMKLIETVVVNHKLKQYSKIDIFSVLYKPTTIDELNESMNDILRLKNEIIDDWKRNIIDPETYQLLLNKINLKIKQIMEQINTLYSNIAKKSKEQINIK